MPDGQDDEPKTVRGKRASDIEWRVAQALEQLDIEYLFQVDYLGGRRLRGGLVLDFLAFTRPLQTPIWVNGEYWHEGQQRAVDRLAQITLDHETRGELAQAVILWGNELQTDEMALDTVRRELTGK